MAERRRSRAVGMSVDEFAGGGPLPDDGPVAEESGPIRGTAGYAGPRFRAPPPELPDLPPGTPTMGAGHERVISHLFRVDVWAEYEELERGLKFDRPAHALDYGDIVDALDAATDNVMRAARLLAAGKVALEVVEVDEEVVSADMRKQATDALQQEKVDGKRSKQITDADVISWMADHFPDEYRARVERRARAKRMVDSLEHLVDAWKKRVGSLDTMAKGSRRL